MRLVQLFGKLQSLNADIRSLSEPKLYAFILLSFGGVPRSVLRLLIYRNKGYIRKPTAPNVHRDQCAAFTRFIQPQRRIGLRHERPTREFRIRLNVQQTIKFVMPLTSPCLLGSNSFSPIKVNATSAPALALELIARILELGRETPQRGERDYTFLLTAALVSKTWSNEARPLLWKFVVVHWESEAKRVLSSSAWGLYQTQSLVVNYGVLPGLEGVAETSLRQLNCGTEGLQRLDIAGYSMLAPAVPLENLCVPALRSALFFYSLVDRYADTFILRSRCPRSQQCGGLRRWTPVTSLGTLLTPVAPAAQLFDNLPKSILLLHVAISNPP